MQRKHILDSTLAIILFIASSHFAYAQKILQDWTKHLKGSATAEQFSARTGVDKDGDAYWCANATDSAEPVFNFTLARYDSTGLQLWKHHYAGTGGLSMTDFLTLNSGDSYVYGIDYGAGTGSTQTCFLYKHDANGNLLWSFTFDPVTDQVEYPDQIFISPVNGDVILTAHQSLPEYQLIVARYTADGQFVWQTSVAGYESGDFIMDESDQIHLLATYHWGNQNNDVSFSYLRLDGNGNLLSTSDQIGGGNSNALASGGKGKTIGLDNEGNVYALAWVETFPGNDSTWTNIMIKKFGTDGQQLWKKRLEPVNGGYPKEIATLLTDGNTGQSIVLGGWGMWKYDSNGEFAGGWYDRRREYFDACQFDQHRLFPLSSGKFVIDGDSGKLSLVDWSDDYPDLYVKGRGSIQPLNSTAIVEPDATHMALYVTWSFHDSVSLHRVVLRDDVATAVAGLPNDAAVSIYPNPAANYFIVTFSDDPPTDFMVKVFDLRGCLMLQREVSRSASVSIDAGDLSPGMYEVVIGSGENSQHQKLMILR